MVKLEKQNNRKKKW